MSGTDIIVRRRSIKPRITQADLADRIDMTVHELIALENNRVSVPEEKMETIMQTLDRMIREREGERQCREVVTA